MADTIPETTRALFRHGQKMTIEEYFQLPETNIHMELIGGILYVYDGQDGNMPAPTPQHQEILLRRQGGYTLGGTFTSRTLNNALVDVSALLG